MNNIKTIEQIHLNSNQQEIKNFKLFAQLIHEKLRQIALPEQDKSLFIAGILLALNEQNFKTQWKHYQTFNELFEATIKAIENTLINNKVNQENIKIIKNSFDKLKNNAKMVSIVREQNGSLWWFIDQLETKIFSKMDHSLNTNDTLGIFYHEFIKYSGGDGKGLGIVLTPEHLTDFMCKLGEINKSSHIVDICCGTGSFLITAIKLMCQNATDDEIKDIKTNNIYGIEFNVNLYTLALTNLIVRSVNVQNITCGDCFSTTTFNNLKNKKITLGLINPPYSQKDKCELEFVEQLLNILEPNGLAVAVVPFSCAIGTKFKDVRKRLMEHHTLKAVFSMPNDIFYPFGANVCVMVWKAHLSHDSSQPTYFGYCKNDGFVKRHKLGRIDINNKWNEIEQEWLELYQNKKVVDGKSALQCVTFKDEWLAEVYMKTDYSQLRVEDFQQTINDYLAYLIKNQLFLFPKPKNNQKTNLSSEMQSNKWRDFYVKDVFPKLKIKKYSSTPKSKGNVAFVSSASTNNGISDYVDENPSLDFNKYPCCISVSTNGECFDCFYHDYPVCVSSDVEILYNEHLNRKNGLLICTILNLHKKNFSYGYKPKNDIVFNETIRLPVKNNQPDWEYMEKYSENFYDENNNKVFNKLDNQKSQNNHDNKNI